MERLENKCLLVADHTLKGLPLKTPDSPVEQPAVERGVEVEEKKDGERATEECCITSLSCVALGLQPTLSETVQNATHLRGKFSHVVFVQHSVLNKQYVYTCCVGYLGKWVGSRWVGIISKFVTCLHCLLPGLQMCGVGNTLLGGSLWYRFTGLLGGSVLQVDTYPLLGMNSSEINIA